MGKIAAAIKEKLNLAFNPSQLEVRDESHKHADFHVIIRSEKFEGLSRLAKHRAVMEALAEEMKLIHAFSLDAAAE